MQACPRILPAKHIPLHNHKPPVTSRLMWPTVPLVTRECLIHLALVVPPPTLPWRHQSRPSLADRTRTAQTITIHTCLLNSNITLNRRPTTQSRVPPKKCGPARGTTRVGSRSSHGRRTIRVLMTGTVGILNPDRRMAGPRRAGQREYLHPLPRVLQLPVTVSQRSILHSTQPRAAPKRPSRRRLLSDLFRFRPRTMALRRFQGTPFQRVRIQLCNKHTAPLLLLLLIRTSSSSSRRQEPFPPRTLRVKLYHILTRNPPTHCPPLDLGETPRRCDTGQGRDRTGQRVIVL